MSFRDSEPVNFKHLMSMGYQQDWLDEHGKKAEEGKEEKKVWNGLSTGKICSNVHLANSSIYCNLNK